MHNTHFDNGSAEYLAENLVIEQLRHEIHHAGIEEGVARCFGEDYNELWWSEYGKTCKIALSKLLSNKPEVKLREGQISVKAVKVEYDIVEVINRYTELRKSGRNQYYGRCPFHDDDHPSLGVNQKKQVFHCFSCQRSGDVINFIMEIEGSNTKQACQLLRRQ